MSGSSPLSESILITLSGRHNVMIVSYEIKGSNEQTASMGLNRIGPHIKVGDRF